MPYSTRYIVLGAAICLAVRYPWYFGYKIEIHYTPKVPHFTIPQKKPNTYYQNRRVFYSSCSESRRKIKRGYIFVVNKNWQHLKLDDGFCVAGRLRVSSEHLAVLVRTRATYDRGYRHFCFLRSSHTCNSHNTVCLGN